MRREFCTLVLFIILIDDDNRVVLKPLDEYESDYINASYVDVSTNAASGVRMFTYTFCLYLGIHYTKEVHCHSRYNVYTFLLYMYVC